MFLFFLSLWFFCCHTPPLHGLIPVTIGMVVSAGFKPVRALPGDSPEVLSASADAGGAVRTVLLLAAMVVLLLLLLLLRWPYFFLFFSRAVRTCGGPGGGG